MKKKCGSCHLKEGWDCEYDDCKGCPYWWCDEQYDEY